jgi:hypothetical protein
MGSWKMIILIAVVVAVGGSWYYLTRDSEPTVTDHPVEVTDVGYGETNVAPDTEGFRSEEEGRERVEGGIRSPIELELSQVGADEQEGEDSGGEVTVGVFLKPLIESPDMIWFIEVPEELSLLSGLTSWQGPMKKGEEKSFQLTFSVPDGKRYELYSRAEVYLAGGDLITKGAGLRIDLGPEDTGPNPPFERVDEEGRRIISYKGQVIEGGQ